MHILLIEPDKLLGQTYSQMLQQAGHALSTVATAQQAIFAADEHRPDLVLLELQLVSHSGIEFLYEFRSYPDWQSIPVMIVSHVPPGEFTAELGSFETGVRRGCVPLQTAYVARALLRAVNEFATIAS